MEGRTRGVPWWGFTGVTNVRGSTEVLFARLQLQEIFRNLNFRGRITGWLIIDNIRFGLEHL